MERARRQPPARAGLPGAAFAFAVSIAVAAFIAVAFPAPRAAAAEGEVSTFALRAAKIYPVSAEPIEGGVLLVRDGKIAAVGRDVEVPGGVPVLELPGQVIIPGLIDAETALTGESVDVEKSLSPEVRAVDAWDFFADRTPLLRGGVTTVYVSPGISTAAVASTRLVSGRGCVVKLAGHDADPLARVIRAASGVQVTLGDLPKDPPSIYDPPVAASPDDPFEVLPAQLPRSRAGSFLALRRLVARALAYRDAIARAENGALAPEPDVEAAALLPLLRGEDYLRVRANRARDIFHMFRFAREYGFELVLEGGREAARLGGEIAGARVPVLIEGPFRPGVIVAGDLTAPTIEGRYRPESLLELIAAGVEVVLHSPTDAEVKDVLLQAAAAVRFGLEPARALRAITLGAAEVLGVAERVGSLEVGKDADFVVLAGDPFASGGEALAVYVDGELVYHGGPLDAARLRSRRATSAMPPGQAPAERVLVRCGRLLTGTGGDHPGGVVVVENGKVLYAGPGLLTRPGAEDAKVIDASRWTVVPGFIDAASYFGARAESLARLRGVAPGESGGAGRSTVRLADAVDPADPEREHLLRAGITTVLLSPPVAGQAGGQVVAWKLSGKSRAEVEVNGYAALLLSAAFRDQELKQIKKYHDDWTAFEAKSEEEKKKGEPPRKNDGYEPFRPLFAGRVPVIIESRLASQLADVAKRLAEEYGMRVIVAGATRLDEAAPQLRALNAGAVVTVPFTVVDPIARAEINIPSRLDEAGLRFAFGSYAGAGGADLVAQVAYAVARGLPAPAALRALTSGTAELFGIDARVGSLAEGKDADLVFLSGPPFALPTRVVGVMVEGKLHFLADDPARGPNGGNER